MDAAGLKAFAFGPLVHFDHVDGGVVIGTRDELFARTLLDKWASVVDFSTTPSALLADRLHARRFAHAAKRRIGAILAERAFWPVFQPIVDLASGDVVGHEALTRFASGVRPDLCFAEAWSAGLGFDLEFTTLLAAVNAARELPPGRWLDLNITPRLLDDPERLRDILWSADRPIVLEITEHEAIEDYTAVRDVVRSLGHDIRLAVDDAGAGVANFGHIVELGPDFVKLDSGLTRRVNGNLGRQALVVGMRHFARTAGCRLIAEGIETEDEARTLTDLGVEFGQGYLFGRPLPIDDLRTRDA
jgi:EAL domain-containing protein (putative c-di-GMP-specific phosphodiesterase class I)